MCHKDMFGFVANITCSIPKVDMALPISRHFDYAFRYCMFLLFSPWYPHFILGVLPISFTSSWMMGTSQVVWILWMKSPLVWFNPVGWV